MKSMIQGNRPPIIVTITSYRKTLIFDATETAEMTASFTLDTHRDLSTKETSSPTKSPLCSNLDKAALSGPLLAAPIKRPIYSRPSKPRE